MRLGQGDLHLKPVSFDNTLHRSATINSSSMVSLEFLMSWREYQALNLRLVELRLPSAGGAFLVAFGLQGEFLVHTG